MSKVLEAARILFGEEFCEKNFKCMGDEELLKVMEVAGKIIEAFDSLNEPEPEEAKEPEYDISGIGQCVNNRWWPGIPMSETLPCGRFMDNEVAYAYPNMAPALPFITHQGDTTLSDILNTLNTNSMKIVLSGDTSLSLIAELEALNPQVVLADSDHKDLLEVQHLSVKLLTVITSKMDMYIADLLIAVHNREDVQANILKIHKAGASVNVSELLAICLEAALNYINGNGVVKAIAIIRHYNTIKVKGN